MESFKSIVEQEIKRPEFKPGGLYAIRNGERDKKLMAQLESGKKAEYKGKTVALDIPFIQISGNSKYAVYKNSGRVNKEGVPVAKILRFGDKNSTVKNDDNARRYSFLKRHKCSLDMDPNKASFWSCWSANLFSKELNLSDIPW
jgi:hypothetical protein